MQGYDKLNQKNYTYSAAKHNVLNHLDSTLYLAYRDIADLLSIYLYPKLGSNSVRMLDYGCGAGLSTKIISESICSSINVDVTGVDINEKNLEVAKNKLPNAKFFCVNTNDDLSSLGKFDLIVCNFVLVEMPEKEMLTLLPRLKSLLSKNGILIITNPTARSYRLENKWYTFNNQFSQNAPLIKLEGEERMKFQEDQPIRVQVFATRKSTESFTFYDFFHSGKAYRNAYEMSGLKLLATHKPKGKVEDMIEWKDENEKPVYKIHLLSLK